MTWHCENFFQVVPDGSKDLLRELPGVKDLEVTAKYPIAEGVPNINKINKYLTVNSYIFSMHLVNLA